VEAVASVMRMHLQWDAIVTIDSNNKDILFREHDDYGMKTTMLLNILSPYNILLIYSNVLFARFQ
jgi:hypothetical protein